MTEAFEKLLARLRQAVDNGDPRVRVLMPEEARVLVAALDTWREALLKVARYYMPHEDAHEIIRDALGLSVGELERMCGE